MRLTGIRLLNWTRYRGTHELALEATVYAVVAESSEDSQRSNWLGKSALLAAVWFAITGVKPRSARFEDDWISNGEVDGGVELEFSDGTFVSRTRKRGKPTQLVVEYDGDKSAIQDEAQLVIDRKVGFGRDDAGTTWFVESRGSNRLVTMDPAERSRIVNAWLGIEPLEVAAQRAVDQLEDMDRERASIVGRMEVARPVVGFDAEQAQLELEQTDVRLDVLDVDARRYREQWDARAIWERARDKSAGSEDANAEHARQLAAEPAAAPSDARVQAQSELRDRAVSAHALAEGEHSQKRRLLSGQFDGVCPVGGIQCPVTARLNEQRAQNKQNEQVARDELNDARLALDSATETLTTLRRQARAHAEWKRDADKQWKKAAELQVLREDFEALEEPPKPDDLDTTERSRLLETATRLRHLLEMHSQSVERLAELSAKLAELEVRREVTRLSALILGRNGAQLRIAQSKLGGIMRTANELILGDAGVPLQLDISWAREGKQPADHCSSCGEPFPKSARAKECTGCGELRGKKLEPKLDVRLSNVSDGAEDLAGLAMQLGALGYLKRERGLDWGLVMIDEPFGALDDANKQSMAVHLNSMLKHLNGVDQALVVVHDRAVLDALPGRILITGEGEWSRVEVVN